MACISCGLISCHGWSNKASETQTNLPLVDEYECALFGTQDDWGLPLQHN